MKNGYLSRPVDPHVTRAVGRAAVLRYLYRRSICLQHVVTQQLPMEPVIYDPQIAVSQLDHPVGHDLA